MIDVLVVDDDFRVAQVHAGFVELVPGFRVAGQAHTAAAAAELAARLRPDLVLLDVYLPDGSGLDLIRELSADVIVLTAADDAASVRAAFSRGALHYVIKPFGVQDLGNRLRGYARYRRLLGSATGMNQSSIDEAMRALHRADQAPARGPKGHSPVTVRLIADILRASENALSAAEIAARIGVSRATAQRYLAGLTESGRVAMTLRYGATGRPEHLYTWC
ncbi:response regulator [Microtetraspora malaysiensis]|uniref:response regulator n=1 Tax=Microtetraspora malaysiensis TaxID=161358 RepID=UPI003D8DE207